MTPRVLICLVALSLFAGCDVCADYCATECACAGDESAACSDTCLDTMDVYSGDYQVDECTARLETLEDTCEEG